MVTHAVSIPLHWATNNLTVPATILPHSQRAKMHIRVKKSKTMQQ